MCLVKGLVSVIIPCYNNAPYLLRCINSVLAQTYRNIEIIIVDDGSTDNPSSVLININDKRLRKVICIPHHGVSTTRNVGIHHALGEFLVFIDGDDWIESNHIELLVGGLRKADCVITMMSIDYPNYSYINQNSLGVAKNTPLLTNNGFNLLLENHLLSSPCNKIYRTRLIKEVNYIQFDTEVSYAEDLLFNLEYFRMIDSVIVLQNSTYHYVKLNQSASTRCHGQIAYTLSRLSKAVTTLFGPLLSSDTLAILMRHYLWGLSNLHHKDSPLTDKQIRSEIGSIISIPEFERGKSTLSSIGIGIKLQWILRLGLPMIIHAGFKYYRKRSGN